MRAFLSRAAFPPNLPPRYFIAYPFNGSRVNGTVQIRGTAINGSLPLTAVKVRIDSGDWITSIGLDSWSFDLNTRTLANGKHHLDAKALDANLSSDTVWVDFVVGNPGPDVSAGGNPWCLPFIVISAITGILVLIALKKRTDLNPGRPR